MKNSKYMKKLGVILLAAFLVACGGAEEEKAKYTEEGKKLFLAGDYEKALLAYKNVLQIDPKDSEGRYQLAEVLSKQGNIPAAFKQFNAIIGNDETHVMARVRAGQLYLLNGRLEEAEKLMQEALALAPDNVEVLVFQAGVNVIKKDTDAAIGNVEKALQLDPDSSSAILMQASIQAKLEKIDEAIQILKQGIEKKPADNPMHLMLANLYLKKQLKPEAESELKKLVDLNPESMAHYRRLAMFYVRDKQLDKAEQVLRKANQVIDDENVQISLVDFLTEKRNLDVAMAELLPMIEQFPQRYPLRFKLVALQLKKGDNNEAVEATLNEVIEMDDVGPAGLKARNALARFYVGSKRVDEARELVKEVLAENPRDADALTLRGRFALADKKIPEAIADFRAVLVDQPNNVTVLKFLATTHLANKDSVLAQENLEKVISIAPNDISARHDLVKLLLSTGKSPQAETHINALIERHPKNLKVLDYLFKIRLAQKEWGKAQQITELVRQEEENKATGFYMSGLAYQAEAKLPESVDAFKQSLKIKPDTIQPLTQLVKSFIGLNQIQNAISYLTEMVGTQKENFVAYNLLGEVYLRKKKQAEAEKAFRQTISIKPEWFMSYRNLAMLKQINKDKAAAIEVLNQGLEKTNGSMELSNDLAGMYHRDGQHAKVIEIYEQAYEKHPKAAMAINNLASYLSDYDENAESLARAAKLAEPLEKSTDPIMLDTVAWIAFKQSHYDKAQQLLEKIVSLKSVHPEVNYHMGMVYYKQGNMESAKTYLDKAVAAELKFKGIEQAKEILESIKNS